MKVIKFNEKIEMQNPTLIMGAFDVIHIGHMELLNQARSKKNKIAVMLFDNTTKIISKTNEYFETLEVRLQKLANLKVDYAIVITASPKTFSMSPEEFIKKVKTYKPSSVVVGSDFKFGFQAKGTPALLRKHFDTNVIPIKKISNKKISSSIIKEQIPFGDVSFANTLTVSPWTTNVTILKNNSFELPSEQIKPHSGFYATTFIIGDNLYHGLTHVTRKGKYVVHLLNNKDNLQNKKVSISWWKQILITIKDTEDVVQPEYLNAANQFFNDK